MPNPQNSQSRQLFLETGARLIRDRGIPDTANLKLSEVCHELGLTSGAAYNIWNRQEDYQLDLALYMVGSLHQDDDDTTGPTITRAVSEGAAPEEALTKAAMSYFERFTKNGAFYAITPLYGVNRPRPQLEEAMAQSYARTQRQINSILTHALAVFDREMAHDLSIDELCTVATATAEGLALRRRYDSTGTDYRRIYAKSLAGLFNQFTVPAQPATTPDFQ